MTVVSRTYIPEGRSISAGSRRRETNDHFPETIRGVCEMHDAKGRVLQVGDEVLIPAIVVRCSGDENACRLDVETVGVMPCNGGKNRIYALSTKQVYRANPGDSVVVSIETEVRDGKTYLV